MISGLRGIYIFALLAAVLLLPGTACSGDKAGTDVVLVMDSSGSMKKTDPLSLRIPAAKMFISLLDKNDRAGIISFSDNASSLSPLLSLDSDGNKNALMLSAEKITSTGLHTNLFEALNKGFEALSAEKNSGRERIIVLMSDGMMDTGYAGKDRELIERLKTDLSGSLRDQGVKVYAVAFTGGSDKQLLEKVSKQTGGFFNLAVTDKDFHVVFTSIFESLKSPDMLPIKDNSFLADKSIEEVTIVATKDTPDTTIQLTSPQGSKYSYRNKTPEIGWFISDNFDMITIQKPAEGKWQVLFSSGKNNKAYVITNLGLMTNFNELYPLFGETLDINVWLEKEGSPVKGKDILDKIEFYYELSRPDGETIRLQPLDKGDGVFTKKIELYTAGNYRLRLVADGKSFQREKSFTFKVSDVKESKEDLKMRQALKEREGPAAQSPADTAAMSWKRVIIQFVSINMIVCLAAFIFFRRIYLKNFIMSKFRRKKSK
ncbi:MAG: VWA domain-containing protein [Nitrospirae bacterium]|nr:VWA domain-containing protein [Nitrospirota bacterium]